MLRINNKNTKKASFDVRSTENEIFHEDFFSKYDQIRSFLRIWSHLLKKTLTENSIFCAVVVLVFLLSPLNIFHTFRVSITDLEKIFVSWVILTESLARELTFKQKYFLCDIPIDSVMFLNKNQRSIDNLFPTVIKLLLRY